MNYEKTFFCLYHFFGNKSVKLCFKCAGNMKRRVADNTEFLYNYAEGKNYLKGG